MPWDYVLIFFVLGILVPWRGAVRVRELLRQPSLNTLERLAVYASTIAFQWIAVGLVLWRTTVHGVGLARLGVVLPHPGRAVLVSVALLAPLLANQFYGLKRLARMPPEQQGFLGELARKLMPQNSVEATAFVALCCTVAACEEFLYRGFVFMAIDDALGGSLPAAIAGSSLLFALAHFYQGRRGLLSTFVVGLLLGGARAWTGSLAPCVVVHLVVDLAAGLAAPRVLRGGALPAAGGAEGGA
ncbi:MAG TPA: CPBP family intramembrane glutamic endopeptidase [Candidatus Acidoferrales bacterium]|nr:CPBP family intramembrane glutamic endopeptidase [Candidatus Acidoferrales bacterium]